jgi:hypothetical protein
MAVGRSKKDAGGAGTNADWLIHSPILAFSPPFRHHRTRPAEPAHRVTPGTRLCHAEDKPASYAFGESPEPLPVATAGVPSSADREFPSCESDSDSGGGKNECQSNIPAPQTSKLSAILKFGHR